MDHRHTRSLNVLVGDDDGAVRDAVVAILAGRELRVHTAATGSDALRILLAFPIDLSILDVEMPDMTGIEVIQRYITGPFVAGAGAAPARRARSALPTIFMSGNRDRAIRSAAERVGTSFFDKPIEALAMRAEVDRILQRLLG